MRWKSLARIHGHVYRKRGMANREKQTGYGKEEVRNFHMYVFIYVYLYMEFSLEVKLSSNCSNCSE